MIPVILTLPSPMVRDRRPDPQIPVPVRVQARTECCPKESLFSEREG